ncbi:MAG: hypothetical protein HC927_12765 [Deltaproteobacteria bacterium]|nr:hypothetical protein [Deltaproteobacteria bacterium]
MFPDLDAPRETLAKSVDEHLRELVDADIERHENTWSWSTSAGPIFATLGSMADDPDGPELTLELVRPIRTLDHGGEIFSQDAVAALRAASELLHTRICIGPHPDLGGQRALLLRATLYLADLQREEFETAVEELIRFSGIPSPDA